MRARTTRRLFRLSWSACLLLAACSGGGGGESPSPEPTITQLSADRAAYFVGEQATLSIAFANGTGRIEPGGHSVKSGQAFTTPPLAAPRTYRLVVTDGVRSVSREIALAVSYRERIREISAPFARGEHAALTLSDGRVLILGGEGNEPTLPAMTYAFDPATETFSEFGSLASGRSRFVAALLPSGDVLVAGGTIVLNGAPRAEIIDGETGGTRPTLSDPVRRRESAAAATLADGRVLITGGLGAGAEATVEIFDPETEAFDIQPGALNVGRYEHTATRIDERRVLIYGGFTNDLSPAPPELYDVVDSVSTALPAAELVVRRQHLAHVLEDGSVLIVGGVDRDDLPLTSVLRFDPTTNELAPFSILATPRTNTAAAGLTDGRLLIAGGITTPSSADVTDTSEILTTSGGRSDGPPVLVARQLHTITLLANGRLLILGGLGSHRGALASAAIFE